MTKNIISKLGVLVFVPKLVGLVPLEKLRQVETLATELVREGLATKKALQKLIGNWPFHPPVHAPTGMYGAFSSCLRFH